jgi:hypothetical protein
MFGLRLWRILITLRALVKPTADVTQGAKPVVV